MVQETTCQYANSNFQRSTCTCRDVHNYNVWMNHQVNNYIIFQTALAFKEENKHFDSSSDSEENPMYKKAA